MLCSMYNVNILMANNCFDHCIFENSSLDWHKEENEDQPKIFCLARVFFQVGITNRPTMIRLLVLAVS